MTGGACDLSHGGICITGKNVKPVGTRIHLEIPVPGSHPVEVMGTVKSIRYNKGEPAAMGIEFDKLEEPALGVISYLVKKHESKE